MIRCCAVMGILLIVLPVGAETIRLSEPVASTENSETFGVVMDMSLPEVTMNALLTSPHNYVVQPFRLTTRVSQVCQKKGCFFIAQSGDTVMRVSFKDYGFFIPTDSANKPVMLAGQLVKQSVSEAQAAHYREDLNAPDSDIEGGVVYEIVADSVRIPVRR